MNKKYDIELIEDLNSLQREYKDCIFRGHLKPEWRLQPSEFRNILNRNSSQDSYEREVRIFKENLLNNYNFNNLPVNSQGEILDKPFTQLMQHYDYQTNLLDWTVNIKVASFMIVSSNEHRSHNAYSVIFLIKKDYARSRVDLRQDQLYENNDFSIYDPLNLLNNNIRTEPSIVFQNRRIHVQNGMFTYRNRIDADLTGNSNIEKILIKFSPQVVRELLDLNFSPEPQTDFELNVDSLIRSIINRSNS